MFKALVFKELRESAGIAAMGVVAVVYSISLLTGAEIPFSFYRPASFPFVNDALFVYMTFIITGLALGLGLKQSAWEFGRGTYCFLLHRPARRRRVFAVKLCVGVLLVVIIPAAAILWYAWWAATPGNSAAPFFWSMTIPAWRFCLAFPLLYLGAFLSGIRPGHWFGSRLVPCVAAAFLTFLVAMLPWVWLSIPILLLGAAAFVVAILRLVEYRDY